MRTFKSRCVTCQNDGVVVMVGFADDELNTTEYLLLQRTLQPDQQDQTLGHASVHIELNSPDQSGYGGVKLIRLDGPTVRIELNEKMAQQLETDAVEVDVSESGMEQATLEEHLSILVGDEPILQV